MLFFREIKLQCSVKMCLIALIGVKFMVNRLASNLSRALRARFFLHKFHVE